MEAKQDLRKWMRGRCAAIPAASLAQASRYITEQLEALPAFTAAGTAALFWSMPHEVDVRPLIRKWCAKKRILLPVMQDQRLLLHPFTSEEELTRHPYGVREPAGDDFVPLAEIDLIVVPGAAFDPNGGRVGWGGGFYDRLLANAPPALPKIGVCFDFQLVDTVPREPHDFLLDGLIVGSETGATLYISPQNGKC